MENHERVIFDRRRLAIRGLRKWRRADKGRFNGRSSAGNRRGASCVGRGLATMNALDYTLVM
jgi:hypothetical protein